MEALKELIGRIDDDYLIGLGNKGILKRAYKDLEKESPVLTWQGEEASVKLGGETCTIRAPIGDSVCSCPSRSICRHVVTAVLWLKGELGKEEKQPSAPKPLEEILNLPADRLKRACKGRQFRQFLAHIQADGLPPIEESSVVTVLLPWENASVKLLEPFEHTSCTCHSRELCAHKAQAALAYQLKKGRLSLRELELLKESEHTWDMREVSRACKSVRASVSHQLCTGLSRQSPEITESLERLAVIAHRAGLPKLESGLREAASDYQQYFSRSAAFREEELFRKLLSLNQRAKKLSEAESQDAVRVLAGNFRDTYEPVGTLRLTAIGGRTFSSKTGYEGEIYYFLETRQKKWYTWTDARPVFYEGSRRRPPAASENALAPWNLNCSREQMLDLEFELHNAKAASGGRLSASQDTKAEIIGTKNSDQKEIREMIVWDYEELLFREQEEVAGRQEWLTLAGAVRWGEASFDTVRQRFSWSIYDRKGRTLFISLKYTKEERLTIQLLERLEQRLRKKKSGSVIFFGSLYMDEDGRLCLYPIEFFLKETDFIPQEDKAFRPERNALAPPEEVVRTMEQYCREAAGLLSDLFVSGLYSLQEETLTQLSELSEDGERLGLHGAGTDFNRIAELMKGKRHRMEFSPEPVLEAMERLNDYLLACREKLSFDRALLSMQEQEERKVL